MSKEKAHWPGWFYGPDGEAQIFQSEAEVPKGWATTPEKAIPKAKPKEDPPEPVPAKKPEPVLKKHDL
jgi:hypothetical protein